jgi:hypothetical protein
MGSVPPEFNPPRQQSGNKVWLWLLLAVGLLCVLCAVGGYFAFRSGIGMMSEMGSCGFTGELAQKALLAYASEHDGKFPTADKWQDEIRPYYQTLYDKFHEKFKDVPLMEFEVPAPGMPLDCSLGGGKKSGFAFNTLLSGVALSEIQDSTNTLLVFETMSVGYNLHEDPAARDKAGKKPTIMGEERDWIDFFADGRSEMMESDDSNMKWEIGPEDAIPPKSGGTSNSTGA